MGKHLCHIKILKYQIPGKLQFVPQLNSREALLIFPVKSASEIVQLLKKSVDEPSGSQKSKSVLNKSTTHISEFQFIWCSPGIMQRKQYHQTATIPVLADIQKTQQVAYLGVSMCQVKIKQSVRMAIHLCAGVSWALYNTWFVEFQKGNVYPKAYRNIVINTPGNTIKGTFKSAECSWSLCQLWPDSQNGHINCEKLIDDLERNEYVPIPINLNKRMDSKEVLLFVEIGMFLYSFFT